MGDFNTNDIVSQTGYISLSKCMIPWGINIGIVVGSIMWYVS